MGQLSVFFGLLALIIAAVGLYGVIAHEVSSRTREIGIRMALGASAWMIMRAAISDAALVLVYGMGLGIPAALGGAELVRTLLYGVSPTDPSPLAAALILSATSLLAALGPARRATRLDPTQVLRYE